MSKLLLTLLFASIALFCFGITFFAPPPINYMFLVCGVLEGWIAYKFWKEG